MKKLLLIVFIIFVGLFSGISYADKCVSGDCQSGQGIMKYDDSSEYEGQWKDGQRNGKGTFTYSDGTKYVGEFKNGNFNGQGTATWSDGAKYVGQWKDGIFNGQGTMTYSDGRKQVGQWKNGIFNGQGTEELLAKEKREKELYSKPHYWLVCASTGYSSNFPPSLAQAMLKKFKLEAFDDESRCADTAWSKNQMANQMGIECGCQFMTLNRQKAEAIVGKERMP